MANCDGVRVAPLGMLLIASTAALGVDVGSPPINRAIDDASSGVTLIYRGPTQPVSGPGEVLTWEFFNDAGSNYATPLLFEVTGPSSYTLVGVGTSVLVNGSGLQNASFGLISGTATLVPGKSYTIGFQTARYSAPASTANDPVPVSIAGASIDFDGYNLTTDPWSYALSGYPLVLGETFGLTGSGAQNILDSNRFGGRIYSARFSIDVQTDCPGDVDFDTDVDFDDLNRVLNVFGQANTGGDTDGDGDTDFDDLNLVLSNFGNVCA